MKPKEVLIITNGFYPEQTPRAFRATELAKELCRQGHRVTVMAPHKENIQTILEEYPIEYINLGRLKWNIFNFKNLGKVGALYNTAVNRLLPLLFEFPSIELFFLVKRKLKLIKNRYDLLISIAVPYPIHWGVASMWSDNIDVNVAKTWIADCGDPYFFQENDTFKRPIYFKWIDRFIHVSQFSSRVGFCRFDWYWFINFSSRIFKNGACRRRSSTGFSPIYFSVRWKFRQLNWSVVGRVDHCSARTNEYHLVFINCFVSDFCFDKSWQLV